MKKITLLIVLIASFNLAFAQKEAQDFKNHEIKNKYLSAKEFKTSFTDINFHNLFTETDNAYVYGFIGDNDQRIRIKFISVVKDSLKNDAYNVYGKSMVRDNIVEFHGTIVITNIRKFKTTDFGVDDQLKNKGLKGQFIILGEYSFLEDENKAHSGIFKGVFESNFYLDKNNKPHYDDIEKEADGYCNNQFVGQWIPYNNGVAKRCNWGDFRIPNSRGLDIGAGEFSPNDKYLKYGWQSLQDLVIQNPNTKKAKAIEKAKWWK
jgi:hypothetical protein